MMICDKYRPGTDWPWRQGRNFSKFFIRSYQKFGPKNGKIPKAPQCLIFRGVIELKVVNTQSVKVHIQ